MKGNREITLNFPKGLKLTVDYELLTGLFEVEDGWDVSIDGKTVPIRLHRRKNRNSSYYNSEPSRRPLSTASAPHTVLGTAVDLSTENKKQEDSSGEISSILQNSSETQNSRIEPQISSENLQELDAKILSDPPDPPAKEEAPAGIVEEADHSKDLKINPQTVSDSTNDANVVIDDASDKLNLNKNGSKKKKKNKGKKDITKEESVNLSSHIMSMLTSPEKMMGIKNYNVEAEVSIVEKSMEEMEGGLSGLTALCNGMKKKTHDKGSGEPSVPPRKTKK